MELGSRPIHNERVFHLHEGLVGHWNVEGLGEFGIWWGAVTVPLIEPL